MEERGDDGGVEEGEKDQRRGGMEDGAAQDETGGGVEDGADDASPDQCPENCMAEMNGGCLCKGRKLTPVANQGGGDEDGQTGKERKGGNMSQKHGKHRKQTQGGDGEATRDEDVPDGTIERDNK